MSMRFVSEPIEPVAGSFDAGEMASGGPGVPHQFTWRGEAYTVAEIMSQWRETGPCRHGSEEQYVRKHWFHFRMTDGSEMKVYFERQPRSKRDQKRRWWLHSMEVGERPD